MTDHLGGQSVAGGKLKETGTMHWNSPNYGATNETGFTALPGGYCGHEFMLIGSNGFWWSSTENATRNACLRNIFHRNSDIYRNVLPKLHGVSVRCVRD